MKKSEKKRLKLRWGKKTKKRFEKRLNGWKDGFGNQVIF